MESQVMFTIILTTDSWHICPHPTKKQEREIITPIIKDILKNVAKSKK